MPYTPEEIASNIAARTRVIDQYGHKNGEHALTKEPTCIECFPFEARIWREAQTVTNPFYNPVTRTEEEVTNEFPARWAVYDKATDMRIELSNSEDEARATAAKWNDGKMPENLRYMAESGRKLHSILKPGDIVSVVQRHVSRSGMMRRLSLFVSHGGEILDITWHAARVMGDPVKQRGAYVQDAGMVVEGCGMDMHFETVYNLGRALFPDGFGALEGTAPNGKDMDTKTGGGIKAGRRPITRARIAELAGRGWKFRGMNGDGSGWTNDGGYALNKRSL